MKPNIILIGGGGHCVSCIDVIEEEQKYSIAGIVDLPEKLGKKINTYEIVGSDADLPSLVKVNQYFFISLGQIKSPERRVMLFEKVKKLGAKLPAIISPKAYVSKRANIGEGTIIMPGAIVNASTEVGKNCIINTSSLIEHNAIVEDHCHISTGAIINGGTIVRTKTFVGSNSVTKENIEIGCNSIIACGLRIMNNLPENSIIKRNLENSRST
ncbi:MAG: NeuD/PglB/VioB family sugar acetyltransferase [Deltaproteobacteria bacterium]|nr:NeuD/PglB/VioB family sugar acetyltransferase [Deltaproteobacteria bacterium]